MSTLETMRKKIESLSREIESLSKETQHIKRNQRKILELKNSFDGWLTN